MASDRDRAIYEHDLGINVRNALPLEGRVIRVNANQLEASKRANVKGTEEYRLRNENSELISAWKNPKFFARDAEAEQLDSMNDGQSHRLRLQDSLLGHGRSNSLAADVLRDFKSTVRQAERHQQRFLQTNVSGNIHGPGSPAGGRTPFNVVNHPGQQNAQNRGRPPPMQSPARTAAMPLRGMHRTQRIPRVIGKLASPEDFMGSIRNTGLAESKYAVLSPGPSTPKEIPASVTSSAGADINMANIANEGMSQSVDINQTKITDEKKSSSVETMPDITENKKSKSPDVIKSNVTDDKKSKSFVDKTNITDEKESESQKLKNVLSATAKPFPGLGEPNRTLQLETFQSSLPTTGARRADKSPLIDLDTVEGTAESIAASYSYIDDLMDLDLSPERSASLQGEEAGSQLVSGARRLLDWLESEIQIDQFAHLPKEIAARMLARIDNLSQFLRKTLQEDTGSEFQVADTLSSTSGSQARSIMDDLANDVKNLHLDPGSSASRQRYPAEELLEMGKSTTVQGIDLSHPFKHKTSELHIQSNKTRANVQTTVQSVAIQKSRPLNTQLSAPKLNSELTPQPSSGPRDQAPKLGHTTTQPTSISQGTLHFSSPNKNPKSSAPAVTAPPAKKGLMASKYAH